MSRVPFAAKSITRVDGITLLGGTPFNVCRVLLDFF